MILQDEGLGLGLRAGVSVERIGGGGHGFIGAVVVAAFVDAERADMHEPLDAGSRAASSSRRSASTFSRRNSSSVPQSPTLAAQLNTQSAPVTPALSASGVFEVADHRLHAPLIEPAGVTRWDGPAPGRGGRV